MSGHAWRNRARSIVELGLWPDNISEADKSAVEELASGDGYEPYYTLKGVIVGIEEGCYLPWLPRREVKP